MTRVRHRLALPPRKPLDYAVAARRGYLDAKGEMGRAFRAAASAGWSMREIAEAVGLSASTVWRMIMESEAAS